MNELKILLSKTAMAKLMEVCEDETPMNYASEIVERALLGEKEQ